MQVNSSRFITKHVHNMTGGSLFSQICPSVHSGSVLHNIPGQQGRKGPLSEQKDQMGKTLHQTVWTARLRGKTLDRRNRWVMVGLPQNANGRLFCIMQFSNLKLSKNNNRNKNNLF